MKKIMIGVTGLVVVCLVVFSIIQSDQDNEESYKIRIGYLNIVASLPLFIAEEMGFFKDEGLEYESIAIGTSNQLVDGLLARNLDCFIEASAVPVLAVELKSPGKLKVFSASEITSDAPFDALLTKTGSSVQKLEDIADKTVGVFPGSTATSLLKKYLTDQGVDISNTTFLPVPPPNMLAALLKGSIDVLHAYEPTTAIALSKGGVLQLHGSVYAEMLSPNPQGVAAVSTYFLEKHPKEAKKVIRALERAMKYMKDNDADSRQILVSRMNLTKDVSQRCVLLYMLPHSMVSDDIFQQYANMLTELGELDERVQTKSILYNP